VARSGRYRFVLLGPLGTTASGGYGHSDNPRRNIDRIGKGKLVFRHFYVAVTGTAQKKRLGAAFTGIPDVSRSGDCSRTR